MTSFSLDTSFVLRILTESPDSQLPAALSFYEEQRQSGNPLFISDLVLSIERIAILPPTPCLIHRHPNTRIHPNRKPHANSRNLENMTVDENGGPFLPNPPEKNGSEGRRSPCPEGKRNHASALRLPHGVPILVEHGTGKNWLAAH